MVGASLVAGSTARATVVADVPVSEMAREAAAVALGRVTRVGSRVVLADAGHRVETVVHFEVQECWAGECAETELRWVAPGGETPWGRAVTHGAPVESPGQELVVFLERDPRGRFMLFGLALGRFEVRQDGAGGRWAVRDLGDLTLAGDDPSGRLVLGAASTAQVLPLAELADAVRSARRPRMSLPDGNEGELRR
ncbi:MAG TPA: hypothetical protein RMF84_07320 [Polyangiaceae bacterium LLY-WYZ-14_1]|nr:hypothetical protein [Polyangiaceae bacterium LLY-WYZ-14_1]